MPSNALNKQQLRQILRQRRKSLTPAQQTRAALHLLQAITTLPGWKNAKRIALYLANDGEIETTALTELCRDSGKKVFLPVIREDKSLEFALWQSHIELRPNRLGIPEPPATAARGEVDAIDLLFMPLVGWDRYGGRLGMGGGYYDRTLAQRAQRPVCVGLAHSCQQVERITCEPWDVRLDFVATDTQLLQCSPAKGDEAFNRG